jgi:hypothetical protein
LNVLSPRAARRRQRGAPKRATAATPPTMTAAAPHMTHALPGQARADQRPPPAPSERRLLQSPAANTSCASKRADHQAGAASPAAVACRCRLSPAALWGARISARRPPSIGTCSRLLLSEAWSDSACRRPDIICKRSDSVCRRSGSVCRRSDSVCRRSSAGDLASSAARQISQLQEHHLQRITCR